MLNKICMDENIGTRTCITYKLLRIVYYTTIFWSFFADANNKNLLELLFPHIYQSIH